MLITQEGMERKVEEIRNIGLIRILMCWEGEEKEITFVEETIDKGPDSSFSVWKQQR